MAIQESGTPTPAASGVQRFGSRQRRRLLDRSVALGLLAMTKCKDPALAIAAVARNCQAQPTSGGHGAHRERRRLAAGAAGRRPSCVREDALSAWWKSTPGLFASPEVEGNRVAA
ncbi:hypothetical protein DFR50_1171, partial [Roseiarcus fermentans]